MNDCIEQKGMPDTSESVLAHRLVPEICEVARFKHPWIALLSGSFLTRAALPLVLSNDQGVGAAPIAIAAVALLSQIQFVKELTTHDNLKKTLDENWNGVADALANSPNAEERKHLILATALDDDSMPILLPIETVRYHTSVDGGTKSGKSSKVVIPLARQIIKRRDASVVILNNKGLGQNKAEFHLIKDEADRNGVPFYHFTLHEDRATHVWDALNDPAMKMLPNQMKTEVLAQGLGLVHGSESNASFWTAANKTPLGRGFEMWPEHITLSMLSLMMSDKAVRDIAKLSAKDVDRGTHVKMLLESLAKVRALNPPPGSQEAKNGISVFRALTEICVMYFDLPSSADGDAAKFVSRFFLRLLTAAGRIYEGPRVECHVYCEEAQEFLQRCLLTPLKQCRDSGIYLTFTYQDRSDLANADIDFRGNIDSNTGLKIWFTALDEYSRQQIPLISGEVIEERTTRTKSISRSDVGITESASVQLVEERRPRFGPNDINRLNANEDIALLQVTPMQGFCRLKYPLLVNLPFSVTKAENNKFNMLPWPEPIPGVTARGRDLPWFISPAPPIEYVAAEANDAAREAATAAPPPPVAAPPAPPAPLVATPPAKPAPTPAKKGKKKSAKPPSAERKAAAEAARERLRAAAKLQINQVFASDAEPN